MNADETAIAQIDTSFLQNGSKGLLLTDRRVYSSWLPQGIDLAEIRRVDFEDPSTAMRQRPGTLLINGRLAFSGRFTSAFWIDALTALGRAARSEDATARSKPKENVGGSSRVKPDWVALAAAAVCNGAAVEDVANDLMDVGATSKSADHLADELMEIRHRPQSGRAVAHIGGGLFAALVGLVVTVISVSNPSSDGTVLIVWGPVLYGLFYGVRGMYRTTIAGWPMSTNELVTEWEAEHPHIVERVDQRVVHSRRA